MNRNKDYTRIRKMFISGREKDKIFDKESNVSDSILETLHLAKLQRKKNGNNTITIRQDNEPCVVELSKEAEEKLKDLSEEEIIKLFKKHSRKADINKIALMSEFERALYEKGKEQRAIHSIYSNIERRINERSFYYFITFTSNRPSIYNNPLKLLKLVKKYLRKQNIEFVIVLEYFENADKGWHVHGITNRPVDFRGWLLKYGANDDTGADLGEKYNLDDAFLNAHNLYCDLIRTDEEICFKYKVKKLEESYRRLKAMYPDEKMLHLYYANGNAVPAGSKIATRVNGFEYCLHMNDEFFHMAKEKKIRNRKLPTDLQRRLEENYRTYNTLLSNALENFLPIFNKVAYGKSIKNKWYLCNNSEKQYYKFLNADLIGIAMDYIKWEEWCNFYGFNFLEKDFVSSALYEICGLETLIPDIYYTDDDITGFLESIYNTALTRIKEKQAVLRQRILQNKKKNKKRIEDMKKCKEICRFVNIFSFVAIRIDVNTCKYNEFDINTKAFVFESFYDNYLLVFISLIYHLP